MVIFCNKWKKYNEMQLTKNKMGLNIRKMTNHPPSPLQSYKLFYDSTYKLSIFTFIFLLASDIKMKG